MVRRAGFVDDNDDWLTERQSRQRIGELIDRLHKVIVIKNELLKTFIPIEKNERASVLKSTSKLHFPHSRPSEEAKY